jgi:hypothetical protein
MSQLDLALAAGISARHMGFVELGRAKASGSVLSRLLDALATSDAERAVVFLHAGFSVPDRASGEARRQQNDAFHGLTKHYAGMPIVTFDSTWNAIGLNVGGMALARLLMPDWDWQGVGDDGARLDMLAATAHPEGLLSHARQPDRLAAALLNRFEADRWSEPCMEERVQLCAEALSDHYGTGILRRTADASSPVELDFQTYVGPVRFASMQCLVAAPHTVTLGMPRMELWLPLDEATRRFMESLTLAA